MSGCQCCQQPPCIGSPQAFETCGDEPPVMQPYFQSKSTPLFVISKCGFVEDFNANPLRFYRVKTTTRQGSYSNNSGCGFPNSGEASGTYFTQVVSTNIRDPNNMSVDVNFNCTAAGPQIISRTGTSTRTRVCTGSFTSSCESTLNNNGTWSGQIFIQNNDGTTETIPTTQPCEDAFGTTSVVYSSEFTTEQLIEMGEIAVEEYPYDWGPLVSATNDINWELSPLEESFSIQRTKYRIVHWPIPTCYLKVWINKIENTDNGNIVTEVEPYIWQGSGNPCLNDPTKTFGSDENKIITEEQELEFPEPKENTQYSYSISKWSFLPDYEPDPDNGRPNGFPNPITESND
jgi:hypothetical protein